MRNSAIVPLAIALGCGLIAAVGVSQVVLKSDGDGEGEKTVEIFVAVNDLDVGNKITADTIRLEKWPADRIPKGSVNDLERVEGMFARQRMFAGEPLIERKLMDSSNGIDDLIPEGFRVVTLDIKRDAGIAYLIEPGYRVDVTGFFQAGSSLVPETTTKTVLSNIRVFAVDGRTSRRSPDEEGPTGPASVVSLLIREEDQEVWTWAQAEGSLKLSLRNRSASTAEADGDGPNAAGVAFMDWIQSAQPKPDAVAAPPKLTGTYPEADSDVDWEMRVIGPSGTQLFRKKPGASLPELVLPEGKAPRAQPVAVNPETDESYLDGSSSPFYEPEETTADDPESPPAETEAALQEPSRNAEPR